MQGLLEAAVQDPYAALSLVLGDTLHPGGRGATSELLDRAGVGEGTRVADLGCGAGVAGELARKRGARPLGIDADPTAAGASVCASLDQLPLAESSVDVALSECALCLADDLDRALSEAHRVLAADGRLAFSDVTLERPIGGLPAPVAQALCLTGERTRGHLRDALDRAGFDLVDVRDHHEDLVKMRESVRERLDYEGLLQAMGPTGERLLAGIREAEAALEAGELGYVSVVARPTSGG